MSIKLKSSQSVNLPKMTHLLMSIPSTTNAHFPEVFAVFSIGKTGHRWSQSGGTQSTFDIREKIPEALHEIIINIEKKISLI
jgi:hypothetical protein